MTGKDAFHHVAKLSHPSLVIKLEKSNLQSQPSNLINTSIYRGAIHCHTATPLSHDWERARVRADYDRKSGSPATHVSTYERFNLSTQQPNRLANPNKTGLNHDKWEKTTGKPITI